MDTTDEITDFLADYPQALAANARRLHELVMQAVPSAVWRIRRGWRLIGYDLPIGKRRVYFAFVSPENEHVHLGFEHGWAMADPRGMLKGEGITKQVRWLTFEAGDEIDPERCAELVREAARVATMSKGERALRSMDAEADRPRP